MSGYDEINRNIAKMIEKGKNSASTSDATYYDKETRRYYSASDIKKLKEINEVKLAEIESLKYYGVSDKDGKITSRKTDIKTNEGVIKRLEEYFGIDAEREATIGDILSDREREAAFNDVMNLIYNESDYESDNESYIETDDSISFSSRISTLSNVTSNDTSETNQLGEGERQNSNTDTIQVAETSEHENNNNLNNTSVTNQLGEGEQQNSITDTIPVVETSEHENNNNLNNTSVTNQLGEGEQQNSITDTIQVAETSEHENNYLTRSSTLLQVSDNRNNLDRIGYGQHPDTGTLSRRNNVLGVSDSWAVSPFYDGPSPAKKDVTKLKKIGNFIKRTFKTK